MCVCSRVAFPGEEIVKKPCAQNYSLQTPIKRKNWLCPRCRLVLEYIYIYVYIYIYIYTNVSETDRQILRNPAGRVSNHKPSWDPWPHQARAAGRPASGGWRRAGGGRRPALQLNLATYVIGTIFYTESSTFVSGVHIYIHILSYTCIERERERERESDI